MIDEKNEQGLMAGLAGVLQLAGKLDDKQIFSLIATGVNKIAENQRTASRGSREDFFKYSDRLEKGVVEKIKKGELQAVDYEIISVVEIPAGAGKRSVDFFASDQVYKAGIHTLNNGRTEKDFNMIVSEIGLLAANFTAPLTDAAILDANFQSVQIFPSLRNAFLNVSCNNRIITRHLPVNSFYAVNSAYATDQEHVIRLDNPKFLLGNEVLTATLEFQDASGVPANTLAMIKLRGTATLPR